VEPRAPVKVSTEHEQPRFTKRLGHVTINPFKNSTLHTTIAVVAILGLTTSAFARPAINRVSLNCKHEDTLREIDWTKRSHP